MIALKIKSPLLVLSPTTKTRAALIDDNTNQKRKIAIIRPIILIYVLVFTSCNFIPKEEKAPREEAKPKIEDLTPITLPLTSSCGAALDVISQDSIKKFISEVAENLKFGGFLKKTENYIALILLDTYADYQIPYIVTITNEGKIIDKFKLFSIDCGEDELYKDEANYSIDKNLKITLNDSSETYKRDHSGKIIKDSIVKSSHQYQFYVDSTGKVKENSTP